MAPRARIAAYKALWSTQDGATASGFSSDLVAAIDQAVADGVDVINYSVQGSTTNFLDPSQVAFFFAADAGVFVAVSAGNSGPTTGTVAHPGPWLTTVAAGTHNRDGRGSVTFGNGVTYNGASVAAAFGPAPLIDARGSGGGIGEGVVSEVTGGAGDLARAGELRVEEQALAQLRPRFGQRVARRRARRRGSPRKAGGHAIVDERRRHRRRCRRARTAGCGRECCGRERSGQDDGRAPVARRSWRG